MKTIQLQIEDDFFEEFMQTLPKDKVILIDQTFQNNQNKFIKAFNDYKNSPETFRSHLENMKELDHWLKEAE